MPQAPTFSWGHVNINVRDLDRSVAFYERLGFAVFLPGIPYLGLEQGNAGPLSEPGARALGLPPGTHGRACIMQFDSGFPKLDLTEFEGLEPREPLGNGDCGMVRLCLATSDLAAAYAELSAAGVDFLSEPQRCDGRLADIALCRDPDGTLIELIQLYLENWRLPG